MGKKTKKSPSKKVAAGGKLKAQIQGKAKAVFGGSSSGGSSSRRRKGVTYWTNKVLVEKLKKKYSRIKFGSLR